MKADIITIGDEILIGQIVDTNSVFIAQKLNLIGFNIRQITTISDGKNDIKNSVADAIEKTNLVILTGGLGPTDDDRTKEALAEYFNSKFIENTDVLSDIKSFASAKNIKLNSRNILQAQVPNNCKIIRNDNGKWNCCWYVV